jgi:Rhodopirellula transposase DDE domain
LSLPATPQAAAETELAQPGDDRGAGSGRHVGCKLINDRHGLRGGDLGRRGEQRRHRDGLLTGPGPAGGPADGRSAGPAVPVLDPGRHLNLAGELTRQGHKVSAGTVGDLLREEGFSLQGNAKTIEGTRHPDRDAQFRYISEQVTGHQGAGDPVISVDTRKKELVGEFRNAGRQWRPTGQPAAVRTHDFPGDSAGSAIPYGVYNVTADAGWVNVGTDHDTAAFAVESIRRWWNAAGSGDYPDARRLLITADAGGSNGYRTRAWKAGLAALAEQTGLEITCCHFPPGTQCRCLTY